MSESKMSNKRFALGIIAVFVIGIVITLGFYAYFNPSKDMVGDYEVGKVYPLAYTQEYEDSDGNRGRSFMLPNTCGVSVPLTGPRGEKNVFTAEEVVGGEMPESSFKLVRKTSLAVTVGAATFQPAYDYVVVVYNATRMEKQEFVPKFPDANNRCSE